MPARTSASAAARTPRQASAAGPPAPRAPPSHVLICGAGIVGVSTAFFLARRGVPKITLVDAAGPAAAASGRAGGFLARDWCGGGAWGALAAAGFDLHSELATELGAQAVGYRRVSTYAASFPGPGPAGGAAARGAPPCRALPWLSPGAQGVRQMASPATTAQVHPARLVAALLGAAGPAVQVVEDEVGRLLLGGGEDGGTGGGGDDGSADARPGAVLARAGPVRADAIVIALGPWTGRLVAATPGLAEACPAAAAVSGRRAHSIIVSPPPSPPPAGAWPGPECVFTEIGRGRGKPPGEPECYPRPDGSVYVCGAGDGAALPAGAAHVTHDAAAIATLTADAAAIAPCLAGADVQPSACYLPVTPSGLPFIGELAPRVYGAAGHGCWGILTGPATGRGVAGLVVGGAGDADAALVVPFGGGR
jgi:glycine/D-amino acid oxidase-like deaminating enzyme